MKPNEADAGTDVIIVGAGPAGLAAAVECARRGARALLLDENPAAGGRIWQALQARGARDPDDEAGHRLISAFIEAGVDRRFSASVWAIEPDGTVFWSKNGTEHATRARRIILATGTIERPMPIPGWTLPGVMAVGAAQIALKTGGLLPHGNTWIAGQGPLIALYAAQAIRAGGALAGIVDLSNPSARWRAIRHLPGATADIRKGRGWLREIRRAGIRTWRAEDLQAEGDGALERITFRVRGTPHTESADLLLLHDGIIPSIQITRALGCDHLWDETRRCWRPKTNEWGETTVPGVIVAGDGADVGGAAAAVLSGQIAALGCAHALGLIDTATRDREATPFRTRRTRALASRPFIDTMFAPRPVSPDDAVLICRCEEVTAGQIREAVKLGCQGLNELQAFTRCGMGLCQGRMCGTSASEVMAAARGLPLGETEPFRTRFPTSLAVGELAGLERPQ